MSQSLSQIYVHIVFRVKNNKIKILKEHISEMSKFMGGVIKKTGSIPIEINGMPDHMHILCSMSKNIALAKLVEEIKRSSSRWIKTKNSVYKSFAWQGGYAAFSVSASVKNRTVNYIRNQEAHHRKKIYREEVSTFLKMYETEFNEAYFFED